MGLPYYNNCVGWDPSDVDAPGGLIEMQEDALEITRATFLRHVDRAAVARLEAELGYATRRRDGLVMEDDYHVTYHRGRLHGARVYYFVHSAIEFVFHDPNPNSSRTTA